MHSFLSLFIDEESPCKGSELGKGAKTALLDNVLACQKGRGVVPNDLKNYPCGKLKSVSNFLHNVL